MNQEEHKKYWDSIAGKKKFTISLRQDLLFSFVKRDAEILDFGCGYGRTLAELAEAGFPKLHGCDISAKMVAQAKSYVPSAHLTINPGLIIPFADATFDCVILLAVLTSIISDKDQAVLVKQIRRVLKPGGIIYVGDFLLNDDQRNIERYRQGEARFGRYGLFEIEEGATLRHHDPAYVRQLFAGFEELRFETVVHPTMNGNQSNGFYFVGRSTGPSDEAPAEENGELQFPDLSFEDDDFEPGMSGDTPFFELVPDEKPERIQLPGQTSDALQAIDTSAELENTSGGQPPEAPLPDSPDDPENKDEDVPRYE